jgi:hypothetical protein
MSIPSNGHSSAAGAQFHASQLDLLSNLSLLSRFNGDRSRWPEAKMRILCKLAEEGALDYIDPAKVEETKVSAVLKEQEDLVRVKEHLNLGSTKAWGIIMKSLTGAALILVQNVAMGQAAEVWSKLCAHYDGVSRDLVHVIKMEIESTSLRPNENVESYKARLDLNFNKLHGLEGKDLDGKITYPYRYHDEDKIFIFSKGNSQ